jgi:hypothetical protein
MTYYYKIFGPEVFIHKEGTDFPVRIQVNYPSGKPFESLDEAKAWAESYILYITDPFAPVPKNDPEDEEKFRLTKEQVEEIIAQEEADALARHEAELAARQP